jgi:NADH-quinone oxidoreductase subunit C
MLGTDLYDRDAVLAAHAAEPAISTLLETDPALVENAKFDRDELTLVIPKERIRQAAQMMKAAGYNFLEDVTCVDWNPMEPRFQITYHILSHGLKRRVRLQAFVDGSGAEIASITPIWPSANFYEREVFDLFGVRFGGHPNLRRIMMPDEWIGHPLRKDYPVEGYR